MVDTCLITVTTIIFGCNFYEQRCVSQKGKKMGHISSGWVVKVFDAIADRRDLLNDEAGYAEITVMLDGGHTIHDVERIKGAAGAAHVVIETTTSTIYVPEQNVVAIETP